MTNDEVRALLGLETPDDDGAREDFITELKGQIARLKEHAVTEYARGHGHGVADLEYANRSGITVSRPYPVGTSTLNTLVTRPSYREVGYHASEAGGGKR